ncbi:hypothetical protein FPOA_04742 [Fusarium poae]|uniref:Apple domain-containing protein n=1 Tax=Fusarium poae TaxID=36050 RepID=A0A1B8AUK9_FUSPO|nr:hypothetical protein FPOA_04742 [Fusarium poae]
MQSMIALIGLAIANLAVASPCKPGHSTSAAQSLSLTSSVPSIAISETSSGTLPQSSTPTQEEETVVTNTLTGGGFSAPDLNNPPTFLQNFQGTGDVKFHQGGCFKEDGSLDNGCASLTASGNPSGKRDLGSMASIFQMLNSLNTGARSRYTVQFYYIVASGGSQACTVSASLGNTQFYSSSLSSNGGVSVSWNHVLTTVIADSASAVFSISMSCTGNGISMILVDSIFISNQVTPQTIGDVKLDFGTPAVDPVTTSKAPVTTGSPETASEEPIHSTSEASPSDVDQTTVSGVKFPTETAGNPNQPTDGSQNTDTEFTSHTQPPSDQNTEETASSTIPPIIPEPNTAVTQSQNEEATTTPSTPMASSTVPPIVPKPSTVMTQSEEGESTPTPGTSVNTPVIPVTPVGPATTFTSGTPGTPVPTRDAPSPSETSCSPMCIPKGDAFERDRTCSVRGIYSGPTYTVPENLHPEMFTSENCAEICQYLPDCKSSALVNGECRFTDVLIPKSEIQTLDSTAPNQGFWNEQRCFQCNDCSLPPLFNPPTMTHSQAEVSSTTAPEETRTRTTEASPTETRNIVCGYVGQYSGNGGPYEADHTTFPKQSSLKDCRQVCDGIRDCKAVAFVTWNKYQNPGYCLFADNRITWDTLVTDEQAAYRAVWADPECDFDLISVPELSFPTTTMAPVDSQPTTLATRTSQQPETTTTPAEVCLFNRGQSCTMAPGKLEAGTFCAYGAKFIGAQWKESREDYPYQDTLEQCAAICQTMKNCESAGYWQTENRCLFTAKKITAADFTINNERSFEHATWTHKSCWACPTCQETPAPITRDITCSYEQGDVCQRVTSNKDGALCNYQGFWELEWRESLDRYPDQSSPAKCAAICRTRDDCKGSGYKDGRCMFSPIVLESQKFRAWPDHSRDGVWDDISCFQCPHCA